MQKGFEETLPEETEVFWCLEAHLIFIRSGIYQCLKIRELESDWNINFISCVYEVPSNITYQPNRAGGNEVSRLCTVNASPLLHSLLPN